MTFTNSTVNVSVASMNKWIEISISTLIHCNNQAILKSCSIFKYDADNETMDGTCIVNENTNSEVYL